jgi:hypothetical protein
LGGNWRERFGDSRNAKRNNWVAEEFPGRAEMFQKFVKEFLWNFLGELGYSRNS